MNIIVSISDAKVSADPADTLVTYSLGSCIGVAVYDTHAKVGGLLHFQLPSSTLDAERARQNPLMFADSGLAWLMDHMAKAGGVKKRLKVRIAGAAQMLKDSALFDIGRRNHAAIRKILWQNGLFLDGEHVGGTQPRTMSMSIADGTVTLKMGQEYVQLGS